MDAYHAVLEILWETDLMGLGSLGVPEDEYSPEARDIADRIGEIRSYQDAERVLKEVFSRHFSGEVVEGIDFPDAGRKFYLEMAERGAIKPPVREIR